MAVFSVILGAGLSVISYRQGDEDFAELMLWLCAIQIAVSATFWRYRND